MLGEVSLLIRQFIFKNAKLADVVELAGNAYSMHYSCDCLLENIRSNSMLIFNLTCMPNNLFHSQHPNRVIIRAYTMDDKK